MFQTMGIAMMVFGGVALFIVWMTLASFDADQEEEDTFVGAIIGAAASFIIGALMVLGS